MILYTDRKCVLATGICWGYGGLKSVKCEKWAIHTLILKCAPDSTVAGLSH